MQKDVLKGAFPHKEMNVYTISGIQIGVLRATDSTQNGDTFFTVYARHISKTQCATLKTYFERFLPKHVAIESPYKNNLHIHLVAEEKWQPLFMARRFLRKIEDSLHEFENKLTIMENSPPKDFPVEGSMAVTVQHSNTDLGVIVTHPDLSSRLASILADQGLKPDHPGVRTLINKIVSAADETAQVGRA